MLGGYEVTSDRRYLERATLGADHLVACVQPNGRLPARLNANWQATVSWDCLPGSAQLAALLLRLHRITPDDRYRDTAARLLRFLKSTQNCESVDPGLRGGIKGAFPFDQLYGRFQVLNYSTASFVEALLRYTFTLP